MAIKLNPSWVVNVENTIPILSPALVYPNMMTQNVKNVKTVFFIPVITKVTIVTQNELAISNGSSFTRNEKKNDVALYPPSEISR